MLTHSGGTEDEMDLESILEEFDPKNQVNTEKPAAMDPNTEETAEREERAAEPTKASGGKPGADEEPSAEAAEAAEVTPEAEHRKRKWQRRKPEKPKADEEPTAEAQARSEKHAEAQTAKAQAETVKLQTADAAAKETAKAMNERQPEEKPTKRRLWKETKPKEKKPQEKPTQAKPGKAQAGKDNIIEFPDQEMGLTRRLSRLVEKGDRYAEGMFPEDREPDTQELKRERLLPGVDYEDELTHAPAPRKKRVTRHPKPDLTAAQLAGKYKRGLAFLRTRVFLAFLAVLAQLLLLLGAAGNLPLPELLQSQEMLIQLSVLGLGVSALIGVDTLVSGFLGIIKLRFELETVLLLAVIATAADAVTMPLLNLRQGALPYTAAASAGIFFALWGRYTKRKAQRTNVRTVAGRKEPYLVTLDEKVWNGEDAYMKWSGELTGFGSQVQDTDGAQRAYHRAAPVILILAVVLSLFASVGAKRPENFFWCFSATLLAGCGFTGFLAYAKPYHAIVERLAKVGAALGGWDSLGWTGRNRGVVVTDRDLFPPGAVKLNGIKMIGDILSLETAVSYVATLVRETGSGMEKPFSDMMRSQGGMFRQAHQVICHEGGVTGIIGGENVIVGSAAFLELMGIEPPPGLRVKNAVFLGVDGTLAAIFALNYRMHPATAQALDSLIENHLDPILATRDFLVIPDMLRQRFKLRVDSMEFPSLDRRRELSSKRAEHDENIAALLCREGLSPYAEAVIGGKRLVGATRAGIFFSLLGSLLGMALAFYLVLAEAYASLSAGSLLLFLLIWLVPTLLVAGWVDRY